MNEFNNNNKKSQLPPPPPHGKIGVAITLFAVIIFRKKFTNTPPPPIFTNFIFVYFRFSGLAQRVLVTELAQFQTFGGGARPQW